MGQTSRSCESEASEQMQMFFQYGCNMERRGLIGLDVFKVKRFERERLKQS